MHNPLLLFTTKQLHALIMAGKCYFVRQTYKRGIPVGYEGIKGAFLLTHYEDLSRAQVHYDAIAADPNRFLYDSSKAEHFKKLENAATQPKGYLIYEALLQDVWKPGQKVAAQINRFINTTLPWKPGRNDGVNAKIFLQFGVLFITLKYRDEEIKVPFSEIEKY
jgi:hypothetical protein